ncbi:hypothetical protein SB3_29840, partial [Methylobacterium radiotolerans]
MLDAHQRHSGPRRRWRCSASHRCGAGRRSGEARRSGSARERGPISALRRAFGKRPLARRPDERATRLPQPGL